MSEDPQNSFTNPNLQHVITPEQGGGRVSEKPNPSTDELNQIPTLPQTPETAAAVAPVVEAEKPWFKTTAAKIGAGTLVVAAGVATTVGLMLPKGESAMTSPETSGTPVASAPAVPGETVGVKPEVLTVKSLELPATLTPEQLGTTFVQDRLSQWEMAGSVGGDQLQKDWVKTNLADKDFLAPTIAKNGDTFADALFVSNWRENPDLVKWVDQEKRINLASLETWLKTYKSGDSNDVEAYKSGVTAESTTVVTQSGDAVTISVAATEHDNADKNRAVTLDPGIALIDGNKMTVNATFQLVNGAWKISALDITSRQ